VIAVGMGGVSIIYSRAANSRFGTELLLLHNGLEKTVLLQQLEAKIREVERAQKKLSEVQKDILRLFA
jgi:hypothetical protein